MTALIDWDSDEQWVPISGHDGYEASTHGRVRRISKLNLEKHKRTARCMKGGA